MLVKYFFKLFFEALSNFLSRTRLCCFVSFAATPIFYQSLSGLSSTFFIFLIPSPDLFFMIPQLPVSAFFWRTSVFYRICHLLSSTFFKKFVERRKRDLNPRAAVNDLLPFQGSPFGQLGYFSTVARIAFILYYHMIFSCNERRGWDSNPRALSNKRFSRPPRYDHFDTSPHSDVFSALAWRQNVFYHH